MNGAPGDKHFGEVQICLRAAGTGSFSETVRLLLMSPSTVSKLIVRIEAQLGVHLPARSAPRIVWLGCCPMPSKAMREKFTASLWDPGLPHGVGAFLVFICPRLGAFPALNHRRRCQSIASLRG